MSDKTFQFETGIGPMTDNIINTILDRLTSNNVKEKLLDKLVSPVTAFINDKIRPYVYIMGILYLIVIVLLIVIIFMLYKHKK